MKLKTEHLDTAIDSLGYSIFHIENLDYVGKYRLSYDQSYKLRTEKLEQLKESRNYLRELIRQSKTR